MSRLNAQNSVPDVPSETPFGPELIRIINDRLRRIAGAGDSTRAQVSTLIESVNTVTSANLVSGPHTNRLLLAGEGTGVAFYETDRTVLYVDGFYAGGVHVDVLANIPTDVSTNDVGFLFWATDVEIVWRWDGAVWKYLKGTHRDVYANLPTLTVNDAGYLFYATDRLITWRWDGAFWIYVDGTHFDTAASIPTLTADDAGYLFVETDRGISWRWNGAAWLYVSGIHRDALANLPGGFGAAETGYLFYATDYHHTLLWNSASWQWAPGETPSGQISFWTENPGTGWRFCNGGTATRLKSDGTTEVVAIPDVSADCFVKGGIAYTGSAVAAVAPGLSGALANESSHTHTTSVSGVTVSTDPGHTHSIDHDHAVVNTSGGAIVNIQAGAGAVAATWDHTHTVDLPNHSANSGSGGSHAHTLSGSPASGGGSAHTHGLGTLAVDATGAPKHMALLPYYRL